MVGLLVFARDNVVFGNICRESNISPELTVTDWNEKWLDIIHRYAPHDSYNMDKAGVFFHTYTHDMSYPSIWQ